VIHSGLFYLWRGRDRERSIENGFVGGDKPRHARPGDPQLQPEYKAAITAAQPIGDRGEHPLLSVSLRPTVGSRVASFLTFLRKQEMPDVYRT